MIESVMKLTCYGTTEEELNKTDHDLVRAVLRWRHTNKLLTTYVKPVMPDSKFVYDGKIHPIISSTKTRTWRTSTEEPSVQNWPKRDASRKEIRKVIRPGDGLKIVSFDYGQIQARNVAMESQDAALVKSFWDNYDIHAVWRDRITEVYPKWVKGGLQALDNDPKLAKVKRSDTKNQFVFPLFFGAGELAISKYLGIPEKFATQLRNEFWEMFPDILGWHNRLRRDYERHGYVTGHTGFRRRAPISGNELINAPIQADEAAIVCDAMNRLSEEGYQASMEIHDDLTFIWPEDEVEANAKDVIGIMLETPFEWAKLVPLVVEMSVGDDWDSQEEVGVYSSDIWNGKI